MLYRIDNKVKFLAFFSFVEFLIIWAFSGILIGLLN